MSNETTGNATMPTGNETMPSENQTSGNETLQGVQSQSWNKIANFWNPVLYEIIDRALLFDVQAQTAVNETIRLNLNISDISNLSSSLVASFVSGIVNSVYPYNVWQVLVLPSNLTEGTDWASVCVDCYRMTNDTNYIVIASWLPVNSTGALNMNDLQSQNTAGGLLEVV